MRSALVVVVLLLAAGVALAIAATRSARPMSVVTSPAAVKPADSGDQRLDGLAAGLERLMPVVKTQESGKDATCWTTVRMMDQHFAGKPMRDEVALLKIEACKTLVYHVWAAASLHAEDGIVHGGAIDAALPEAMRKEVALMAATDPVFPGDAVRSVMSRDYHRVTENKRYLFSIMADALTGTGLFEGRAVDIEPLSAAGVAHLAAVATQVTTSFLTAAGERAKSRAHARIEADDVRDAFAEALPRFSSAAPASSTPTSAPRGGPSRPLDPRLLAITRRAIDGKIAALRAWNGKVWKDAAGKEAPDAEARQRELIGRMVKTPFEPAAFTELQRRVGRYLRFIATGAEPMQRNTFSAAINGLAESVAGAPTRAYVDLAWARNVYDELFPRSIAANGDVTADLMGVPAQRVPDKRRSVIMLDWELDAVRDTTLHWTLMKQAWDAPDAKPADAFALELIADRTSELAFLFIKECEAVAVTQHRETIGADICEKILQGSQFAVPAEDPAEWTAADREAKQALAASCTFPLFTDASRAAGLPAERGVARPAMAESGPTSLVDLMGSGVAVGDIDGDGLPDLFLPGDGGNRLLRNLGGRRFEDVGATWGIVDTELADAHHALFVDVDNDGLLDLFVVHSQTPSRLFRQESAGHFTDITASCGIVTGAYAHDAVFFDYDNDGLLDCYVGHYGGVKPTLDGRNGGANRLFHNLGGGRFADVTERSGTGSTGWTLATAAIDVDRDGRMDLFVANDYGRSELFLNRGDGTFAECGHAFGVDDRGSSMNASVIDADGDGWMDIYITQIDMFSKSIGWVFPQAGSQINVNQRILKSTFYIAGNKLFRNDGGTGFTPIDQSLFEPGDRGWSWSGNFLDYDNDGDDDCFLSNGWVDQTPAANQSKQMFLRQGAKLFQVDADGPECYHGNGRGAITADLTGTGRMDLVVSNFDAPPVLLANACANANRWLKVKLHGTRGNRSGVGAVVVVEREGGLTQTRQINCGANYLSQDELVPTFGLGALDQAAAITVTWPGKRVQRVAGPFKAGTLVEITEPAR